MELSPASRRWLALGPVLALGLTLLATSLPACAEPVRFERDSGVPPREGPALPPRPSTRTCLAGVDLTLGSLAPMPAQLSATQCFTDVAEGTPAADLIPFGVNSPLWTDGAAKARYLVLPPFEVVTRLPDGTLEFPVGTVLVKEFAMLLDDRRASSFRRLETRFVVRGQADWGFFTYRYDEDGEDAQLLATGADEELRVRRDAVVETFPYHFPSRAECATCHSAATERSLGFRIDQLNGLFNYTGVIENQLVALNSVGVFAGLDVPVGEELDPAAYPAMVDPTNEGEQPEDRARAYLHANCSHCHRPLGQSSPALTLDLRIERSLADTHLCDEAQFFAPAGTRRIAPGDPDNSFVVQRMESTDPLRRMPPLGRTLPDYAGGVRAVRLWAATLEECP